MKYYVIKGSTTHHIFDDIVLCGVMRAGLAEENKMYFKWDTNRHHGWVIARDLDVAQLTVMALLGLTVTEVDPAKVTGAVKERLDGGKYDA